MNWEEIIKYGKVCKKCNANFGNVPEEWDNKCPLCGDDLK